MDGVGQEDSHFLVGEDAQDVLRNELVLKAVVHEVLGWNAGGKETADLFYKALGKAGVQPRIYAADALFAAYERSYIVHFLGQEFRAWRGVHFLLEQGDFQGADGAAPGLQRRCVGVRAEFQKARTKRLCIKRFQLCAELRVGRDFREPVPAGGSFYVEPGAAAQDGDAAAGADVLVGCLKVPLVVEDGIAGAGLADVYEVVRDFLVLVQVLAGSDVHSAINLPRVAGEDFRYGRRLPVAAGNDG